MTNDPTAVGPLGIGTRILGAIAQRHLMLTDTRKHNEAKKWDAEARRLAAEADALERERDALRSALLTAQAVYRGKRRVTVAESQRAIDAALQMGREEVVG